MDPPIWPNVKWPRANVMLEVAAVNTREDVAADGETCTQNVALRN
jgi:hypothetical protein